MSFLALKEICSKYVDWVSRNPQTTSEIENVVKWMSYFLAGRISNSSVISELAYSVSNLVVVFNDHVIRSTGPMYSPGAAHRLKTWLTVLEYSEVFVEVSALRAWGAEGRWIVIVLIQTFKCISRLLLLHRYKENIVQNPPLVPLKRSEVNRPEIQMPPEGFSLRSGRVIRTVDAASPLSFRSWRPPELPTPEVKEDARLSSAQILGEMLYISKPLVHLATLYKHGPSSWKPWVLALAMDTVSLQLLKAHSPQGAKLSKRQRVEISRRQVSLLLYLLRSPFYEAQTRDRLDRFLESCARSIPLVGAVLRPLRQYVPHWQRTYFYMWSA